MMARLDPVPLTIGEVIRLMRHRHGMSLRELAERIGSSAPTLSRLENGSKDVRLGVAIAALEEFGLEMRVWLVAKDGDDDG